MSAVDVFLKEVISANERVKAGKVGTIPIERFVSAIAELATRIQILEIDLEELRRK